MQGVRFLSLLLLLVVANSFVNGGDESLELNPVAVAAERAQSEPGARFTMEAIYSSASLPQPVRAHGSGAYNSETGLSEATLKMSSPESGQVEIETIADGTHVYLRGSGFGGQLPEGKEWLGMEPLPGHSQEEAMLGGAGADSSLQMLSSAGGEVRQVGREKVRGTMTKRYRATIDLAAYGGALRDEGKDELADQYEKFATMMPTPPTVEAWIDAKGLLRRFRMVMEIPTAPGAPAVRTDMRMELFDFGAQPAIALPDEDSVFDIIPVLEEQLEEIETA